MYVRSPLAAAIQIQASADELAELDDAADAEAAGTNGVPLEKTPLAEGVRRFVSDILTACKLGCASPAVVVSERLSLSFVLGSPLQFQSMPFTYNADLQSTNDVNKHRSKLVYYTNNSLVGLETEGYYRLVRCALAQITTINNL